MTDVILRISGMDCGACAVRIVCALRGLPGVHAVFVSDTAGCARLTYDEAAVGLGEIARCVQRAGFDVPVETAELRCPGADDGAEARLRAVFGVRSAARAGDTFMVTLWPVGTDAAALPAVLGPGAELTAQRGGEEAQQGRTRQRLARRLGFGVLLTALMLWRLPELVQLALAAAVLFGAGAALWRGTWRVLRGALHAPVRRLRHLRPRTATVVRDGVGTQVDADALTPRNVVRVLPGERVPVDGVVCSGTCTVDASALTGAARPAEKAVGDAVLAGTLNRAGSAFITPTAIGDATALQRTIAALQRAQTVRTPEQVRLERAASRLTALLVLLAIGVGAVWLFWRQPGDLARALTCTCAVLAATCPGAAGQAAGVAAPAEIGRAAERGELLTHGAEASAARTARTVRRCIWLLLAYHAVCLPLAACGVIGPAAAAVLACGASGGVLLCALRGKETKRERP